MNLDYTDIGNRVRRFRYTLGISQQKLAELSGQEPSNISHIERGATKLSLPTLVNIANALDVSADDLLCGSLPAAKAAFDREAAQILSDCTLEERKIIIGTMRTLREHHRMLQESNKG